VQIVEVQAAVSVLSWQPVKRLQFKFEFDTLPEGPSESCQTLKCAYAPLSQL